MRHGTVTRGLLLICLSQPFVSQYTFGHILFGDIQFVDVPKEVHISGLRVLLLSLSGQILRRQSVSPGGRYRFNEVRNGDYYLVVETNGEERVRIHLFINEFKDTDLRHDLELTLSDKNTPPENLKSGPPIAVYARPADTQSLFEQAQLEFDHQQLQKAQDTLKALVDSDPDDFEAWTQLGTVHFQAGDQSAALGNYRKALSLNSDYLPALLNLGKLEMLRKSYQGAIKHLSRVVVLAANLAEAHYLLGEGYLQTKKGSKAVEQFHRALELEPRKMADAHLRMAALYRAAGYMDMAVEEYRQFLAKRPHSPQRKELERFIAAQTHP